MEGYLSDKEQIQIIKNWWKKYGNTILLSVILVLGASFGWRFWHNYKNKRAAQASVLYEQMISANTASKISDFKLFATHLIKDYASTPYASLASLLLAEQAVNANNLALAKQDLQWVIEHGSNDSFQQIARIRKARILIADQQLQPASQLLQQVDDKAFMPAINETRGDIFAAQGDKTKALQIYKQALHEVTQKSVMRSMLEMKINQMTQ